MVRGDRGNCILKLRKRPSRLEKGVSLIQGEALFNANQRPLCLLIVVFTPLSIRRGDGGEASSLFEEGVSLFLPFRYHDPCSYVPLS